MPATERSRSCPDSTPRVTSSIRKASWRSSGTTSRSPRRLGAEGIVLGILTNEATIDRDQTARLIALVRPLRVTFHKAFDQTPDLLEALDTLIALGVERVLTSGGRPTAMEGVETLAKLVDRAGEQIAVMAGGSLNFDNLETIIRRSRAAKSTWDRP